MRQPRLARLRSREVCGYDFKLQQDRHILLDCSDRARQLEKTLNNLLPFNEIERSGVAGVEQKTSTGHCIQLGRTARDAAHWGPLACPVIRLLIYSRHLGLPR